MRITSSFLAALAILILCGWASTAYPVVLVTNPGTGTPTDINGLDVGVQFTVGSTPVSVSSLGIWDQNTDGLDGSHQVGLWTDAGSLLGSVVVPTGTAGTLLGEFRYADLSSPILLSPGQTYRLAAAYGADTDAYRNNDDSPTASSDFNTVGWTYGGGFTFPNNAAGASAAFYVGPNFIYSVPEPASAGLLLVCLAGASFHRRAA